MRLKNGGKRRRYREVGRVIKCFKRRVSENRHGGNILATPPPPPLRPPRPDDTHSSLPPSLLHLHSDQTTRPKHTATTSTGPTCTEPPLVRPTYTGSVVTRPRHAGPTTSGPDSSTRPTHATPEVYSYQTNLKRTDLHWDLAYRIYLYRTSGYRSDSYLGTTYGLIFPEPS